MSVSAEHPVLLFVGLVMVAYFLYVAWAWSVEAHASMRRHHYDCESDRLE